MKSAQTSTISLFIYIIIFFSAKCKRAKTKNMQNSKVQKLVDRQVIFYLIIHVLYKYKFNYFPNIQILSELEKQICILTHN